MNILPRLRVNYGETVGVELFFYFPALQGDVVTYLDADSAAAASSFTANGTGFSSNDYITVGQPGAEKSELLQVSGTPSGTTIAIAIAATFAHNRGDAVRLIPFNQIIPERSTDGGTTYTPLSAISIRADSNETYLQRTSDASTDYYRFRFYNSTTALYSAYSDPVIATGYGDNTVWSVKRRALSQLGEEVNELITDQFLDESLMEARRIADQNPAVLRWSFRTQFGVVIGQILSGQWKITAPTDLRDRNTNKNILSLRMGNQNRPVDYQDRRRFNQNYLNVRHSTTSGSTASGATSMVLASTHDLDSTGTLTIANNSTQSVLTTVTYTGNNKSTNTLTGCTYNTNRIISTGTDVWQNATFGLFSRYTIDAGTIYFDTPLKTDYDGQDLKGDYYKAIPVIDSDADTFDEPFYDLYVPFLKYKIKYKKANGKIDRDSDTDYKDWQTGLATLISQETPGQYVNFVPDISGFLGGLE